ncbi:MAG: porin [Acidobacteria bacterium]|nr:porin [Acidobacteriota bacterium]
MTRLAGLVMGVVLVGSPGETWAQAAGSATGQATGQGTGQSSAAAAPSPSAPTIKLGVTIFADYTVTDTPKITDATGDRVRANAFTVGRSYLNVTGTANRHISFRVTADIARTTEGNLAGSQVFRLKYAYLDVALPHRTSLRFGMQQTPMIDGQESVYRYRFQGTSFVERDGGLVSSDVGLTMRTPLGAYGDVHAGIYNGEGYNRAEVNAHKAFMARVTVRPMPTHAVAKGLRLIGYWHADAYVQGAPRNRAAVSAMFEHARFNAGVDYVRRVDQPTPASAEVTGQGYSVFVTPFANAKGDGVEGLFRVDHFEPDSRRDASWRRVIAGVAYWFPRQGSASAALLANLEQVTYSNFAPTRPTERRIGVYALINF